MRRRVAVFNHSSSILVLFGAVLDRLGFEVTTLKENVISLNLIRELAPDLIILGSVTGRDDAELALLHELRSCEQTLAIPVLVATTAPDLVRARLAGDGTGPVTLLEKPFSYEELAAAVHRLVPPGNPLLTGTSG